MNRKKKWLRAAVVIGVLVAAFVVFVPQEFFDWDSEKELQVYRVVSINDADERVDITEEVDLEALEIRLYLMEGSRYRSQFSPYYMGQTQYEIDLFYGEDSFHILLGDSSVNYLYESAERGGYKIKNSEVWLWMMKALEQDLL